MLHIPTNRAVVRQVSALFVILRKVLGRAFQDFRGHVVQCASPCHRALFTHIETEPEICKFECARRSCKENVLQLDVPAQFGTQIM
eukprot:365542-Chlamydomonas_euryale.AAC.31